MAIQLKKQKKKKIAYLTLGLLVVGIAGGFIWAFLPAAFVPGNGGGGPPPPPPPPPPEPIYPSNPSITINNGELTTNITDLTLTLYCDDADEMSFQIYTGMWTNYTTYATTYSLTLSEGHLTPAGTFKIEVVFKNEDGTTKDADPNRVVYDDIIYIGPNDVGNGEEPYDYTLIYVLLGVLGALTVPAIVLTRRRKRKKY